MTVRRTHLPTKFRWPDWAVAELGKSTDAALARRLGIHYSTVAAERQRRGIPPAVKRAPIEWTPEMIARLGTDSDRAVAEALGISPAVVGKKRTELGIEPARRRTGRSRRAPSFWTPEREALLGTDSDQNIADRLGIPQHRAAYRRRCLGIPAFRPRHRIDWKPIDPYLGKYPDQQIADRFGLFPPSVYRRRIKLGIPPHHPARRTVVRDDRLRELVRKPNAEITEISKGTVAKARKELNVPTPPRPTPWTPEVLARLGKEPDETLAEELGLKTDTVRHKRYEMRRWLRKPRRRWTERELELLRRTPDDREVAQKLGRSLKAVRHMRAKVRDRGSGR